MPIVFACAVPHPPLIIPAVGKGREADIQVTADAYAEAARRLSLLRPETVVIISPHSILYADYIHVSPGTGAAGDFGFFGARQAGAAVRYDTELVAAIAEAAGRAGIPAGTEGERNPALDHGTLVPLHFLHRSGSEFKVVRISISGLPYETHFAFGRCIAAAAAKLNRRVAVVASGDLSHKLKADGPYGFAPQGPAFDRIVTESLREGALERLLSLDEAFCEAAAECGLRSFQIMAGALDALSVTPDFLSYQDTFGVGYAVCCFAVDAPLFQEAGSEDLYVRLARHSLETYIRTNRPAEVPEGLPEELSHRAAGVFVSLKKRGALRGCIGTISPTTPSVGQEIIQNAVWSGTQDTRFPPVQTDELQDLTYSVDVLLPPQRVSGPDQLDPLRYGVIVSKNGRRGLLLPRLEGIDTVEQQLNIAMQKAGIGALEGCTIERFEVIRHS